MPCSDRVAEHRRCIRETLTDIKPGAKQTPDQAYLERSALLLTDILEELEVISGRPTRPGIFRRLWAWLFG